MGFFPATVAALAAGRHVECARLIYFDFVGTPKYVWTGTGRLAFDHKVWEGAGDLISISEIQFGQGDQAGSVTFGLSGVDPQIVALARGEQKLVKGQAVTIYGLFFDEDHQPLDTLFSIFRGVMDIMSFKASGSGTWSVTLPAETIWTGRQSASWTHFGDKDQQKRFPGDKGFEFISTLVSKRCKWPDFGYLDDE